LIFICWQIWWVLNVCFHKLYPIGIKNCWFLVEKGGVGKMKKATGEVALQFQARYWTYPDGSSIRLNALRLNGNIDRNLSFS
jgi:hypothetical protein